MAMFDTVRDDKDYKYDIGARRKGQTARVKQI